MIQTRNEEKIYKKRSQLQNALSSRLEMFVAALHFQLGLGILKLQMEELFHSPAVFESQWQYRRHSFFAWYVIWKGVNDSMRGTKQ